jgi:hypothetical protein
MGTRGFQKSSTLEEQMQARLNVEINIIQDVAMDKDQLLG